MSVHIAVLKPDMLRLILSGRKTIESRLTHQARPPFGCISRGERIYLKQSGGPFVAVARVHRVWMTDGLTPADVDRIARTHNQDICGPAAVWREKRKTARYATLIWLRDVQPTTRHPRYRPQHMRAWYTLDDSADPLAGTAPPRVTSWDIRITAGGIRNGYLRLTGAVDRFPSSSHGGRTRHDAGRPVTLRLTGGQTVRTDIVANTRIFRWRGWTAWFHSQRLKAGDAVRFTPDGRSAYRVEPVFYR